VDDALRCSAIASTLCELTLSRLLFFSPLISLTCLARCDTFRVYATAIGKKSGSCSLREAPASLCLHRPSFRYGPLSSSMSSFFFFFFLISFLVSSRFFLRLSRIVIDARTLPHERLERDSHFWITRDSPRRTYGFPPDFLERNKNGRRSDFRVVARRNRSASNRAFRYHFILASISSRVINTRIRGRISDLARRTCT